MKRFARTLELSLASHSEAVGAASQEKRRKELLELPKGPTRLAALGIDAFAQHQHAKATFLFRGLSKLVGNVSYLGNGAFASVYQDGDEVIKVYRDTAAITEDERQRAMTVRQGLCSAFEAHFDFPVATQRFAVEEHPLGDYRVVTGRQPYVPGQALNLFEPNTLDLQADAIGAYCERQLNGQEQLAKLAEETFVADDRLGLVPDINGRDNIRLVGHHETPVLIDVEPIGDVFPEVHDQILRQAEILGQFVA